MSGKKLYSSNRFVYNADKKRFYIGKSSSLTSCKAIISNKDGNYILSLITKQFEKADELNPTKEESMSRLKKNKIDYEKNHKIALLQAKEMYSNTTNTFIKSIPSEKNIKSVSNSPEELKNFAPIIKNRIFEIIEEYNNAIKIADSDADKSNQLISKELELIKKTNKQLRANILKKKIKLENINAQILTDTSLFSSKGTYIKGSIVEIIVLDSIAILSNKNKISLLDICVDEPLPESNLPIKDDKEKQIKEKLKPIPSSTPISIPNKSINLVISTPTAGIPSSTPPTTPDVSDNSVQLVISTIPSLTPTTTPRVSNKSGQPVISLNPIPLSTPPPTHDVSTAVISLSNPQKGGNFIPTLSDDF